VSVIYLHAFSQLLRQRLGFLPFPSFLFLNQICYYISGKPKYEGSFLPNRFGIPPGHRWDGVDRSNGYEKQWFEKQNARRAIDEEAYKWSTSDM
jgi:hypothetical protein